MKTQTIHRALLLAVVVLMPTLLHAQMPIKQLLFRVNVPFAFVAGGVHLPPGNTTSTTPGTLI